EQFIERIRWGQRHRRSMGILFLILAVLMVGLAFYWINDLEQRSRDIFQSLDAEPVPTTQQFEQTKDEAKFGMGFFLGFALASMLASGGSLGIAGLTLLFGRRREKLLLKYWDDRAH